MTAARILAHKKSLPVTIRSDATIAQAVEILAEKNIGALIVSDDGLTVDGILSERDIIRGLGDAGAGLLEHRVATLMVTKVQTVAPTDTVHGMLARMTEGRFRHLPVMENDRLAGIVSIGDVVKLRLDDLLVEAEAMRDYIAG